jgi:uncharacterized membrane protein
VPAPHPGGSLWHDLTASSQWPHYVAYVVSFLTIGIIWINHHAMIRRLRATDQIIMTLNLLLLMTVVVLPFTTSLVATYLRAPYGHKLAAAVWSGSFLVMSLAFSALHRHILFAKTALLAVPLSAEDRRRIYTRNTAGLVPYVIATVIAVVSAYASVIICAAIAVFYALPFATSAEDTLGEPPEPPESIF